MADPVLNAYARAQAQKYGVPVSLFMALGGSESGRSQSRNGKIVTSPKGARGWGQLMPATAKSLGVNPDDPYQNIEGSARYLKQQYDHFGSWRLALAAYNAGPGAVVEYGGVPPFTETVNYVHKVLTNAGGFNAQQAPSTPVSQSPPEGTRAYTDASRSAALTGLADLASGRYSPTKALQDFLAAQQAPVTQGSDANVGLEPAGTKVASDPSTYRDFSILAPGADRAGVPTQVDTLNFVGHIGQLAGQRLTIGTGTNHTRLTVNGSVSDHWTGQAADIPASGDELRSLGYYALIAAGMSEGEARKAAKRGGLFNVGRYQIIFATDAPGVGNHFDHLHVGIRG